MRVPIPAALALPTCFESEDQFNNWTEAAKANSPGMDSFCADCTPAYKYEMKLAKRCKYPKTWFDYDKDGSLDGHRSVADKRMDAGKPPVRVKVRRKKAKPEYQGEGEWQIPKSRRQSATGPRK